MLHKNVHVSTVSKCLNFTKYNKIKVHCTQKNVNMKRNASKQRPRTYSKERKKSVARLQKQVYHKRLIRINRLKMNYNKRYSRGSQKFFFFFCELLLHRTISSLSQILPSLVVLSSVDILKQVYMIRYSV